VDIKDRKKFLANAIGVRPGPRAHTQVPPADRELFLLPGAQPGGCLKARLGRFSFFPVDPERSLGQHQGPGQDHNLHHFVGGPQDVAGDAAQAALKVEADQPDQGGGGGKEHQARDPQDQES
jgi:hypothetical protein